MSEQKKSGLPDAFEPLSGESRLDPSESESTHSSRTQEFDAPDDESRLASHPSDNSQASESKNGNSEKPKRSWKEKILEEVIQVGGVMLYLAVCFAILETFKCATLLARCSENDFLSGYATAGISAVALGKFVFILEKMKFTKRFNNKPLMFTVLYKSVLFTILVNFILHAEDRLLHRPQSDLTPVGDPTRYFLCFFAHQLAFFVVFFIFFCFREISAIVGEERMRKLFFVSRDS